MPFLTEINDGGFGLGTSGAARQEDIAARGFADAKEGCQSVGCISLPCFVVSVGVDAKQFLFKTLACMPRPF